MARAEFDLIQQYFQRPCANRSDVHLGIGDDAALLAPSPDMSLVVTVDSFVADVHFPLDTPPEAVGHKALAVNLSDLAAMGAEPMWLTLAITLPEVNGAWLSAFARGFFALADEYGVQLVGGDTCRGPLSITVQAMGRVPEGQALTRQGARAGEGIFVTGTLGDAAAGLQVYEGRLSGVDELLMRLERPTPRVAAGMALRGLASSAIDVSDGLAVDLGHILDASGVGAEIQVERLPLSTAFRELALADGWQLAVSGGDDYELCFTLPLSLEIDTLGRLDALDCPCTRIGTVSAQSGLYWRDGVGNSLLLSWAGFEHFAAPAGTG
jgi:thiamine-monophosphate kinase